MSAGIICDFVLCMALLIETAIARDTCPVDDDGYH